MTPQERKDIEAALAAPFDPQAIRVRPGQISGSRALVLHYVDARVIQDRLDQVLGVTGWQDEYEQLDGGAVVCRLRLRIGEEWITKEDVGGRSEQPDVDDKVKSAFSDALKRAAVKFGIGRYLYRLPAVWADYDPKKRQFIGKLPALPKWAIPAAAGGDAAAKPNKDLPANGEELEQRLAAYEARLAKQGVCKARELLAHVVSAGMKAGYPSSLSAWSGPAIQLAVEETKRFEAEQRSRPREDAKPTAQPETKPEARPSPLPRKERPYDTDQDPAEVIGKDQVGYLVAEALARGWTLQGLEASVRDKYHVGLTDMSVGMYRECLQKLEGWQKGQKGAAS